MLATNIESSEGLIPFRSQMLQLVYGDMEYVRSVLGLGEITRDTIIDYFDNAKLTWAEVDYTEDVARHELLRWCRHSNIRPLHYYAPIGMKTMWFKDPEAAFLCRLKFSL